MNSGIISIIQVFTIEHRIYKLTSEETAYIEQSLLFFV